MALKLTCPACTTTFALADHLRGKKEFCPNCGQALIVTSGGVAKRDEVPLTAALAPPRNRPAVLLAVLGYVIGTGSKLRLEYRSRRIPDAFLIGTDSNLLWEGDPADKALDQRIRAALKSK